MDIDRTLDCYGLLCPMPIIKIAEAIRRRQLEFVKDRGQFKVRHCDAAESDIHSFSGRENDIVQLEFFDFFDDFPELIAQAGLPAHLSEALPQDIGQEADQDVSLDAPPFLMPDGAQPEVVFLDAERFLGVGQLNVGCPEIFRLFGFDALGLPRLAPDRI